MLSIAMATIAEFESRYQVSNTHQEADIAGIENGGCLPLSSRSPAFKVNALNVFATASDEMLNARCRPALAI